ncbi:protein RKD2-like [Andrographis paniculata]|uniref:protein RKD2-like n=1 Tax=Andrographis paniculata TaxID=175694 RepID=UPI0021E8F08C|nr:protein RKD2-like [Andrographis paniculata]
MAMATTKMESTSSSSSSSPNVSNVANYWCSNYESLTIKPEYDDVFSLPAHLPFSDAYAYGYDSGIFQTGGILGFSETGFDYHPLSIADMFLSFPDYAPNHPHISIGGDGQYNYSTEFEDWAVFDQSQQPHQQSMEDYDFNFDNKCIEDTIKNRDEDKSGVKRSLGGIEEVINSTNSKNNTNNNYSNSKDLSKETISQYFYMPITKAARELNVGLTLLKKRCRQLGIQRWPHRKLMSLQTLIRNVQEMGKEGGMVEETIEDLEIQKRTMEEIPDKEIDCRTKRLRQACFKANYKKRKLSSSASDFPNCSYPNPNCSNGNGNCSSWVFMEGQDNDEFFNSC